MEKIILPERSAPVFGKADICVIGGSCTGVFAAVRAARLGAKVIIIEKQNRFGGVAVSSLVNIWHSLLDTDYNEQIIAGLTLEMIEKLSLRNAVTFIEKSMAAYAVFNSEELAIELDKLVLESGITPLLHTSFTAPFYKDGKLTGVVVENKSGCGVVLADYFIDASGDSDLCVRCGCPYTQPENPQPPTTCAKFSGWKLPEGFNLGSAIRTHAEKYNLRGGYSWGRAVPGSDIFMLSGTRVFDCDCASGKGLTAAEIEGRRQVRAIMDILEKEYGIDGITLQTLPSMIGIRETRHIDALYRVTGKDLLNGVRFNDAIANGTYNVDIHLPDSPGIIFRYLDGTERYSEPGKETKHGRWREPVANDPKFYQVPFRSMVPRNIDNLVSAGRMLDADTEAYGALRVMVNTNQMGEAAGVAAALALDSGCKTADIPTGDLRKKLASGGSIII